LLRVSRRTSRPSSDIGALAKDHFSGLPQHRHEHIDGNASSETAPPRIHAADDLIRGPDEESSFEGNRQGGARRSRRGPDPEQYARYDHDPQDEIGRLSYGDGTCLAIAKKPLQDLAQAVPHRNVGKRKNDPQKAIFAAGAVDALVSAARWSSKETFVYPTMVRILAIISALAMLLPGALAAAENIAGRASVIDGDTIEIHGTRIRLWGIDAPESDQLCRGHDSELYRCGQKSAAALAGILYMIPRPVICAPKDRDQYGRVVATCKIGEPGPDIAHWMVSNGHALDWPQYSSGQYAEAQQRAEPSNAGMWAGSFVEPWRYRSCARAGGRPSECSDMAPFK
jgi:endonuclease YncB( thermonuclease family)